MKTFIVLLAAVAFASAGTSRLALYRDTRSLSSMAVELIESLRDQMPCGFEKLGIPPLAPLKIEHKEIDINGETVSAQCKADKVRVEKLNEFEIVELKINPVFSRVTFTLAWSKIGVNSIYDLEALLKAYGFTVNLKGAGDMDLAVNDLIIKGTIKYSLGLTSNQIKLKEFKIVASVGDVDSKINGIMGTGMFNQILNEFIEEFITMAVNDNEELITQTIEDFVVPMANSALNGKSLPDLIAAVGGGGGTEPTVCNPPTD